MGYSVSEAARLLNVSTRTLTTWLAEEPFIVATDPVDRRSRALTVEQVEYIAHKHKRKLDDGRLSGERQELSDPNLDHVHVRLAQLEAKIVRQEAEMERLRAMLDIQA